MENLDRLFRDAKRLKPDEAMWKRIAQGVEGAAKAEARAAAPEASSSRSHWGWRLAAGFALAVGALAALLATHPGSGRSPEQASQEGPKPGQVAVAPRAVQAVAAEENAMDDVLDWHADLGEAEGWDEDDALINPLLAE